MQDKAATASPPSVETARTVPGAPSRRSGEAGDPVLYAADIHKSFHRGIWPARRMIEVLNGASFEVRPGQLVGLVGENGSGKSTLMKIIVGMLARDGGTIEHTGKLGYCPQTPLLWEKLRVDEHFELFARAYELDARRAKGATEGLLEELHTGPGFTVRQEGAQKDEHAIGR